MKPTYSQYLPQTTQSTPTLPHQKEPHPTPKLSTSTSNPNEVRLGHQCLMYRLNKGPQFQNRPNSIPKSIKSTPTWPTSTFKRPQIDPQTDHGPQDDVWAPPDKSGWPPGASGRPAGCFLGHRMELFQHVIHCTMGGGSPIGNVDLRPLATPILTNIDLTIVPN